MACSCIKIDKNNPLFNCIDKFVFINAFKHKNIVVVVIYSASFFFHICLNKETIYQLRSDLRI